MMVEDDPEMVYEADDADEEEPFLAAKVDDEEYDDSEDAACKKKLLDQFGFSEKHLDRRRACKDINPTIGGNWIDQWNYWEKRVKDAEKADYCGQAYHSSFDYSVDIDMKPPDPSFWIKRWFAICSDASQQRDLVAYPEERIKCFCSYSHARLTDTCIEQQQVFVGRVGDDPTNRIDLSQICNDFESGSTYGELEAPKEPGTYMIWHGSALHYSFEQAAPTHKGIDPPEQHFIAWLTVEQKENIVRRDPSPPVFLLEKIPDSRYLGSSYEQQDSTFILEGWEETHESFGFSEDLPEEQRYSLESFISKWTEEYDLSVFLQYPRVLNSNIFYRLLESERKQDVIASLLQLWSENREGPKELGQDGIPVFYYFFQNPDCARAIKKVLERYPGLVDEFQTQEQEEKHHNTLLHVAFEGEMPPDIMEILLNSETAAKQLATENNNGLKPHELARSDILHALFPDTHSTSAVVDSAAQGADRLGYLKYAKALTHVTGLVEKPKTSFCVGIYSKWGGGKSFLWRLIQQELEVRCRMEDIDKARTHAVKEKTQNMDPTRRAKEFCQNAIEALKTCEGVDNKNIEHAGKIEEILNSMGYMEKTPPEAKSPQEKREATSTWNSGIDNDLEAYSDEYDDQESERLEETEENSSKKRPKEWAEDMVSNLRKADMGLWRGLAVAILFIFINCIDGVGVVVNTVFSCLKCMSCWDDGSGELPEGATKHLKVEFNAWLYQGSDLLWASLIKKLWDVVEDEFGPTNVRLHRASIQLSGEENGDSLEDKIEKREMALLRQKINTWLSVTLAILGSTAALVLLFIPAIQDIVDNAQAFVLSIIAEILVLAPFLRQGYVYIKDIRPYLMQARGDAIVEKTIKAANVQDRKDFTEELGFMGEVKKEIEYLFDFLLTTYLIDEEAGCRRKARLSVFIDDLDRCPHFASC